VTAEPVGELALMRDRPMTVFATRDGWRYMNWKPIEGGLWLWDLQTQKPLVQFASATGREGGPNVISPDTRLFAMVGYDRTLRVWDTASGELRASFDVGGPDARALAITPDGKRVVVGHVDGSVRFWDLATGMGSLSLKPRAEAVSASDLRFSRDGRWLAVTFFDKTPKDMTSQLLEAGPPAKK
jgi:WD40 repeat protein